MNNAIFDKMHFFCILQGIFFFHKNLNKAIATGSIHSFRKLSDIFHISSFLFHILFNHIFLHAHINLLHHVALVIIQVKTYSTHYSLILFKIFSGKSTFSQIPPINPKKFTKIEIVFRVLSQFFHTQSIISLYFQSLSFSYLFLTGPSAYTSVYK